MLRIFIYPLFSVLLCAVSATELYAQGNAFTYQGSLANNGVPFTGSAEFQFTLWDSATNGIAVATNNPASIMVPVNNGLFTVTLDFGSSPFNGVPRFLQTQVRTTIDPFATLAPRQPLTPTPYAILAGHADGVNGLAVQQNTNGAPNVIGGSPVNYVSAGTFGATIAGGGTTNYGGHTFSNRVTASFGTVGGGWLNSADGFGATVSGGGENAASDNYATVGGGDQNKASGYSTVVSGGLANTATNSYATVGGGTGNTASKAGSTVAGGENNTASGAGATVPGGFFNVAAGDLSLAGGQYAYALHKGAFVWADSSSGSPFSSTGVDQFLIRAAGGVGIGTASPQGPLHVLGNRTGSFGASVAFAENSSTAANAAPALRVVGWGNCPNGVLSVSGNGTGLIAQFGNYNNFVASISTNGTFTGLAFSPTSDRNAKENFELVDCRDVLEKVVSLPVTRWTYKAAPGQKHIGPVAQDFQAAFHVGEDDRHIATVDADGVAMAAIQGLNQKLEDMRSELKLRNSENAELKQRLEKLERLVTRKDGDEI